MANKVDLEGTIDTPRAMSYPEAQALIDNNNGAVETKKPISSVPPVDRIEFSKAVLDSVGEDNAALPSNPTVLTNGADRVLWTAATLNKLKADNAELPPTPSVKKGTSDRIDYDPTVTEMPVEPPEAPPVET